MTYSYKLARRLARLRAHAFALGAALSVACTSGDGDALSPNTSNGEYSVIEALRSRNNGHTKQRVVSFRVIPDTVNLEPLDTTTFAALAKLSDGSSTSIKVNWSASGGTIDSTGKFTAFSRPGTYHVVATTPTGSLRDTAVVIEATPTDSTLVPPPAPAPPPEPTATLTKVTLAPASVSLTSGATQQFTVSGTWSDGGAGAVIGTYSATGGTISSTGMYSAGSVAGSYRVIATDETGSLADTVQVTIQPLPATLTKITLTPASVSLTTGGTRQFAVSGTWSDGSAKAVSATYSETGGAISSTGLYTAGSATGSYRVIATDETGSLADTALVTIESPPAPTLSSVTVTPSSATLAVGGSVQLAATAKDAGGATMSGISFTWTSANPAVATVSSAGVVKGLTAGTVTVSATAEGLVGKAAVSVTAPAPAPSPSGDCSNYSNTRLVPVSTASQLSSAITNARPGDLIELAAGTYAGYWSITTSGTSTSRIVLCGPRTANIGGTGTAPSPINLNIQASYWTLSGFTMRDVFTPLWLNGAHHVTVTGLEISNVGDQAIAIQKFSTYNLINSNYIHDTGKSAPEYGEGIYVGSANHRWANLSTPDKSDNNTISTNIIGPNIGAQMVDVKEGTTGTIVSGNKFNGTGGSVSQDAWVNVYGNQSQVLNNTGTTAQLHGVKVEMLVTGWGAYNVFHGNNWNLGGATGYGFRVGGGTPASTVDLGCDNTVTNADSGFATVPCSP